MTADRSTYRFLAVWHGLALALLLLLPVLKFGVAPWAMPFGDLLSVGLLLGAYLASALVTAGLLWIGQPVTLLGGATRLMGAFSLVLLFMWLTERGFSRITLLAMFAGSLCLTASAHVPLRFRAWALSLLGGAVVGATGLAYAMSQEVLLEPEAGWRDAYHETTFYNVRSRTYLNHVRPVAASGGAISPIGDRYLLATGDGYLYLFWWEDDSDRLSVEELPYRVPANPESFQRAAAGRGVHLDRFRVNDLLVQEQGELLRVFASHQFWKEAEECFVTRISMLETKLDAFTSGTAAVDWTTLFESQPCLPIKTRGTPYSKQHGGRLLLFDDATLLVTLGDNDFNGLFSDRMLAQDRTSSYGKTLLVPVDGSTPEIFTLGHRNPQGLHRTPEGEIWATEHGPKGGDELNRLQRGENYGWPIGTYGANYESYAWPLNPRQGEQDGFSEPVFAWVPSIGASNVAGVEKDLFADWQGDLLVASMARGALWRVRVRDGRVVFAEPVEVNHRIRDVIEGADGRIILWTDNAAIVSLTPADTSSSDPMVVFATSCGACHTTREGADHSAGPNLLGIVGRTPGSVPGYPYSEAMRKAGGQWTPERLDRFLANPAGVVAGTSMGYEGMADESRRAIIVEYLATLK